MLQKIARGRHTYGIDVGVMLLDADFPRPKGDLANGTSFHFPVHYEVTKGAPVGHVVEKAAEGLLESFIGTGIRLLDRGARTIATSCGFLAIFQQELVEALGVPVATSSLLQIPLVLRMLPPEQRVCLLTVSARGLDDRHFKGAGITAEEKARIVVVGLEQTEHFYPVVVQTDGPLDVLRAQDEVVAACVSALTADPTIGAFVFECTNLPPYSQAVRDATGMPVWDALTLVNWLQAGANGLASR